MASSRQYMFLPLIFALVSWLPGRGDISVSSLPARCITCLGAPLDVTSTAYYFPIDGFHRMRTSLSARGKPELLFLGIYGYDAINNAERWPVVKALMQFGTLSHVSEFPPHCSVESGAYAGVRVCTVPSFDLSRARYTSRYLAFTSKDMIRLDLRGTPRLYQRLSPQELRLFNAYSRYRGRPMCRRSVHGRPVFYPCTSFADYVAASSLPLIAIGNYVQTQTQIFEADDFNRQGPSLPIAGTPEPTQMGLTFDEVLQALRTAKDPPGSAIVEKINAEANIITALICHADRSRPRSVCGRAVIRSILRRLV